MLIIRVYEITSSVVVVIFEGADWFETNQSHAWLLKSLDLSHLFPRKGNFFIA